MKRYTIEVWREGKSRWEAFCQAQQYDAGTYHLGVGHGNGTGPDPAEAAHDAMIAAELDLNPSSTGDQLESAVGKG